MLPRTLEPEVMDTAEEAADYDSMDHREVNRVFIDDMLAAAERFGMAGNAIKRETRILDVGTGTAQIPIELCIRPLRCHVVAIDLAVEMLLLAERNVRDAGLHGRILLEQMNARSLPCDDGEFDWVMSNSIIHHIPEPRDCLAEMLRVLRPGGLLFVRDLLRPENRSDVEQLVSKWAGDANPHQQQLFRQSLHAALTIDEVQQLLADAGWPTDAVQQTTDRHWTLCGTAPLQTRNS